MKFILALVGMFAATQASTVLLPATTLIRSPSDDSAIVHSERLGGSFSYSTLEGHAYKAITPVVQNVVTTYAHHLPLSPYTVIRTAPSQIVYHQSTLLKPSLVGSPLELGPAYFAPEIRYETLDAKKPEENKVEQQLQDDTVTVEAN